jgi:hypothetical protein
MVGGKGEPDRGDRTSHVRPASASYGVFQAPAECGVKNRATDELIQIDAVMRGYFPKHGPFTRGIHPEAQATADIPYGSARSPFRRLDEIARYVKIVPIQQRQHSVLRCDDVRQLVA